MGTRHDADSKAAANLITCLLATFHSTKITRETDKFYKLVEAFPPTILSRVQTLLRDPPTDAPYTKLKAELLCLTSVSDRQRYHALVKEEALGDRKPSELLRRMRSQVGNMKINDKFFKEMFLERLPTSVQTILASGSDDLEISKLAEMADRMMEVERLSSPTIVQVSQPLNVSTSDLGELKTQIAQLSATVAALQLRRSSGPSRRSFCRDRRRSRSRPRTANLCWYHVNYGDKARRCVPPCSFKSTQANSSAGERRPNHGLYFQAVNSFPITTFGFRSLSLRAAADPENWTDHLPLAFLGIRSALKPDLDCSAAELVFGSTDRLPGEMISPTPQGAVEDPTNTCIASGSLCGHFLRFLQGPPPLRLISRRTWQHALTSTFDVIESAGLWNLPMTAHFGCTLTGRRLSAFSATIVKRSHRDDDDDDDDYHPSVGTITLGTLPGTSTITTTTLLQSGLDPNVSRFL
nr:unnamed protein product [Spirometra erinaceieuropaei]